MAQNGNSRVGQGLALVALVFALPEEARGVLKAGDWQRVESSASQATYLGSVDGVDAVIAVSGVGKACAEATAREVIEEHRPDAVLSLGFAGGLVQGQKAGDLIVAETLMSVEIAHGRPPRVSEPLASGDVLVRSALQVLASQGLSHQSGICLTASRLVSRPEDKAALGQDSGALAVEEESFWIGHVCCEHNVPFLAVRAIVDAAGHPLPGFVAKWAFGAGTKGRWQQALPVLVRPWWIPGLVRLGKAAARARWSLTLFALAFVASHTQEPVAPTTVEPG